MDIGYIFHFDSILNSNSLKYSARGNVEMENKLYGTDRERISEKLFSGAFLAYLCKRERREGEWRG